MAYIDYTYYVSLYGEIDVRDFNRFELVARRKLDNLTTGIDGVRKLKVAFPTDEDDAETVKHCMAALISAMRIADNVSKASAELVETESGVHSSVITSVSAGNESIHYASVSSANATAEQETFYVQTVKEYLVGVTDANGVNLLYMGPYPIALTDM